MLINHIAVPRARRLSREMRNPSDHSIKGVLIGEAGVPVAGAGDRDGRLVIDRETDQMRNVFEENQRRVFTTGEDGYKHGEEESENELR